MNNNSLDLLSELAIKYFSERNFKLFVKALLTLKEEVIKLDPENLDAGLVDLVMDENMWDFIAERTGSGYQPNDFDWEAAGYIAADLQEILSKKAYK